MVRVKNKASYRLAMRLETKRAVLILEVGQAKLLKDEEAEELKQTLGEKQAESLLEFTVMNDVSGFVIPPEMPAVAEVAAPQAEEPKAEAVSEPMAEPVEVKAKKKKNK